MKNKERMTPIPNKRKKNNEIRPLKLLNAIHEKNVKRNIPDIHENEPLAIILENPSNKIQYPIDHIDNFRQYLKDSVSYHEQCDQ